MCLSTLWLDRAQARQQHPLTSQQTYVNVQPCTLQSMQKCGSAHTWRFMPSCAPAFIYANLHPHRCIWTHTMHAYTNMHMRTQIRAHMCTCTHTHTCTCAYTHMCTHPGSPMGSSAPLHPWLQPRPFHVLTATATPKCMVPPRLLCEEIRLPPPKTTLLGCPSHPGHGGMPRCMPSLRQVWRELSFSVLPAWRWVFSPSLLPRRMRLPCQCVSRGPGPPGGCPVEDNAPWLLLHS